MDNRHMLSQVLYISLFYAALLFIITALFSLLFRLYFSDISGIVNSTHIFYLGVPCRLKR